MIDIHSHILFAVDDGAQTLDDSIAMARKEAEGGTTAIFATPHVIDGRDFDRFGLFEERRQTVMEKLAEEGIATTIHPGAEVYPNMRAVRALDEGKIALTLAGKGKHMLVDTPLSGVVNDFETFLFEVQARGVTPILAHPERTVMFQMQLESLEEFIEKGIACQINAGSLSGRYGPKAAELGLRFLRRRLAHFVASDMHRASQRPILGGFVSNNSEAFDREYIRLLTTASGSAVVEGTALPTRPEAPPEPVAKKGWISRILGK